MNICAFGELNYLFLWNNPAIENVRKINNPEFPV